MAELYGRQWEASYGVVGEAVFHTWSKALSSYEPAQIKTGLDALISDGGDFPPNLIKFLRLCRTRVGELTGTALPPGVQYEPEVAYTKTGSSELCLEGAKEQRSKQHDTND